MSAARHAQGNSPAIRDAASVILVRHPARPEVLMGQRGAGAAFMPNKMVFPGGGVDPGDALVPLDALPGDVCTRRLGEGCAARMPGALVAAAIRELWEETGLVLGAPGAWPDPPPGWRDYAATGHRPSGRDLRFVFRAITPPGRPRRFDARFFLADGNAIRGNPDDLSRASGELSALQWVPIAQIRQHDLPFITQVVLAEVAALIGTEGPPDAVPFFRNDDERSLFERLTGAPGAGQ